MSHSPHFTYILENSGYFILGTVALENHCKLIFFVNIGCLALVGIIGMKVKVHVFR